ncbi:MAG: type II toxin-antitoxin system VapC family toxin [Thermodesulfobacteriota bacterium]|nr:type II toxin-antitoxin system VapC family toxin [Thermodesulfobacteriota bacterium]
MKYLLDTCVISELVKPTPNRKVVAWLNELPSEALFLCAITIGEVRKGLTKLPNSSKKERLTLWLNTLLKEYKERIFSIDFMVCENWGVLQGNAEKASAPMSSIDSLLAAITYTHNLILATRNESDFSPSNIPIINPWKL